MAKPARDELEEQARRKWEKSPATQAEFAGDFDSYLAWYVNDAQGRVKILGEQRA